MADQQPTSPGADPRSERLQWWFASTSIAPSFLAGCLGYLDAADRAADPPWIRVRCDEATVERIILALCIDHGHVDRPGSAACRTCNRRARAVLAALAALAGEQ